MPTPEDEKRLDLLHDIFGRERHATDRDDMRGVGPPRPRGGALILRVFDEPLPPFLLTLFPPHPLSDRAVSHPTASMAPRARSAGGGGRQGRSTGATGPCTWAA